MEIVLALISIAVTTAGIGYVTGKWHFARKNGAYVIERYKDDKELFFPAFLKLYSFMPQKFQKKFPKFILYYLAQKGLISIRIEANGNVKIMRTGEADIENETEKHLMDSIFQNTQEYFLSDDAIVGLESVNLNEIRNQYAHGMLSCPLGYQLTEGRKATLSNPGNTFVLDKDHMDSDLGTAWLVSIVIGIFSMLPASVALMNDEPFGIAFFGTMVIFATFDVPIICSLKGIINQYLNERKKIFKNASPLVCEAANSIRLVIDVIILVMASGWGLIVYLFLFFEEATGITSIALLYCLITTFIVWIKTIKKRKNKVMSYGTAENDLFEFIEYIKKKFKNLKKDINKRSMNFDEAAEYIRGTTEELLPFASLFGKKKDINTLLLEEKTKLPTWINTERDLNFEQADLLIDENLMRSNPRPTGMPQTSGPAQSSMTQPPHGV